jgi:hypothetical protein
MIPFQSLLSVFGALPEVVVLIVAGMYMSRTKRIDAKLLFAGSTIHVLVRLAYLLFPLLSVIQYESSGIDSMQNFYTITGVISFLGSVLFCVGLVQLIQFALTTVSKQS